MKNVHFSFGSHLSRRAMLRGAGVCLGLPLLEAMTPAFAVTPEAKTAKRFVGVSLALGLHNPNLVPETSGRDYKPSRYLAGIQDLRNDFTVVSGSSHPGVTGGHTAEGSIFSACPNQRGATSLDQLMAKHLGHETRFPSLVLNTNSQSSPSYTENGSMIPAENSAMKLFTRLFVNDSPAEQERQAELIRQGRSVMDIVGAEARALQREVGAGDRDKLDSWFTSVRELEQRLAANESWTHKPKPKVTMKPPTNIPRDNEVAVERIFLDIIHMALATDSTRFITLHITGNSVQGIEGVDESYHNLSHHGMDEEKLAQLALVEQGVINEWAAFLRKLKTDQLLGETMVLLTSNLGNASAHDNKNMPVLLAGGGFKHGQHLAFDQKDNHPLPNLYLSALQRLGLEEQSFATSTGTMSGLA
jgi:BMFP domain-containing protein YqiC